MKVKLLGSTKIGYELPINEAIIFSGKEAGICYMSKTIEELFNEPEEKTLKRANRTMKSGHHSVFGHTYYNFSLEELPKIIAMVINNEKVYQTSEKSARYTKMKTNEQEEKLYQKWISIFLKEIEKECPEIEEAHRTKLAQENARYLISIFTPGTSMGYTVDLRQLNYIIHWIDRFIKEEEDTQFNIKIKNELTEFRKKFEKYELPDMNDGKGRDFSLFAKRKRKEEWGENYSTNYLATFSQLGQAQRHRTINYEITIPEKPQFFVPPIIKGKDLQLEWLEDIKSLEKNYPQGMLIEINERGTVENFVLKCKERLCGAAQLEIALQTKETLDKYIENTKDSNQFVYEYLLEYSKGARCTFKDFTCTSPCVWGPKYGLNRKV